jgi:hypothetical protein
VIYTDYGWDQPIADAAAHIEPYFTGSYWTGTAPPIGATVFPTNAVIDLRNGVLLAGTGDIADVDDILDLIGGDRRDGLGGYMGDRGPL